MGLSMMYWEQLDKMEREMIVERTQAGLAEHSLEVG